MPLSNDRYEFGENAQFGEVLARSVLRFDKTLKFSQWLQISYGRKDEKCRYSRINFH